MSDRFRQAIVSGTPSWSLSSTAVAPRSFNQDSNQSAEAKWVWSPQGCKQRMSILPSSPTRSPRTEPPAVPHGSQLQCWQTGVSSSKRQNNLRRDLCRPELMSEAHLQQIPAGTKKWQLKKNIYNSCGVVFTQYNSFYNQTRYNPEYALFLSTSIT